jgi:hypothetical protein
VSAANISEQTKETIEDVRGDLHLYEIGEIDLTTLSNALAYSARQLKEQDDADA